MKKKLSKRQLDVMKVLWNHSSPMVASDIVSGSPCIEYQYGSVLSEGSSERRAHRGC